MTPDVNVLVAAALPDHSQHDPALRWLRGALAEASGYRPFILLPMVAVGFVRVATNRHFLERPLRTEEAVSAMDALLQSPHVRVGAHGDELPRFLELCSTHSLAGGIVSDAWIAASVLQLNEHLVTFDRGFRRLLPPRHLTVLSA